MHHSLVERLDRPSIVFVTVCSAGRRHLLATETMHRSLVEAWRLADNWSVGRYVVLPDHIHLFCAPRADASLGAWMSFWRAFVARRFHYKPLWQRGFWDTQLRSGESYDAKWEYVRNNPVRHKLTARADDWPYAGELNVLPW